MRIPIPPALVAAAAAADALAPVDGSAGQRQLGGGQAKPKAAEHPSQTCLGLGLGFEVRDSKDWFTPLFVASCNGHLAVVELHLRRGADKDTASKDGLTPLYACQKGHLAVVELLLDRGGDKDKADDSGETPLMKAAYWGHSELVELLLRRNARLDLKAHSSGQRWTWRGSDATQPFWTC